MAFCPLSKEFDDDVRAAFAHALAGCAPRLVDVVADRPVTTSVRLGGSTSSSTGATSSSSGKAGASGSSTVTGSDAATSGSVDGGSGAAGGSAWRDGPSRRSGDRERWLDGRHAQPLLYRRRSVRGLFCENFEQGQLDPAKWDTQMGGSGMVMVQQTRSVHPGAVHRNGVRRSGFVTAGARQVPVAIWRCIEWEFGDDPDAVTLWVDGKQMAQLNAQHIDFSSVSKTAGSVLNGKSSGIIGGFSFYGFGIHDWGSSTAVETYYDDLVLDTKRVSCLQ